MIALMVASAAMTAMAAAKAGQERSAQYDAQRAANTANAEAFEQQAVSTRREGVAAETLQRRRAGSALEAQLGAQTQGGVDAASGSALQTYRQSFEDAEVDALNIRYGAEQRARGYTAQAGAQRFQANVAGMNSRSAQESGYMSAAGSVLNSISGYYRAGGGGS